MKDILVRRLLDSFCELERAIHSAKSALGRRESTPPAVLERLSSYEEILNKQRSLFTALCGFAKLGNWEQVGRHIRLINGLSEMIRDDARDVARLLQTGNAPSVHEPLVSQLN